MEICNKLRSDLAMLNYIYLDVDDCWLTSSMPEQKFKLQNSPNYANIEQNSFSWRFVDGHFSFNLVGVHIILLLPYGINNDRHNPVCLTGYKIIVRQVWIQFLLRHKLENSRFWSPVYTMTRSLRVMWYL